MKVLALFLLIGIMLIIGAFIYVHVNREKLGLLLKTKLEETFDGNVQIKKVRLSVLDDFPNFSLTLLHTTVKDSLYEKYMLDIEKISFRVSLFDLFRKQINVSAVTLENGSVFLFKDISGYSNTSLFKSFRSNQNGSQLSFVVKQFFCNNIAFGFQEQRTGKVFNLKLQRIKGKLMQHDEKMDFTIAGTMHVDSTLFRTDKGSYLRNKDLKLNAQIAYDRKTNEINFQRTTVIMDEQQYFLSGCLIFGQPLFMNLYIDNPSCYFDAAKTALSPKIQQSLSTFSIKEPVDMRVSITGESWPLHPPMVDVSVRVSHQDMKAYKIDFTDMTMHGLFTNHLERDKINDKYNSGIFLAIANGRMEYIPFSANLTITDLEKLFCRADWKTRMDLTDFNMLDVFDDFYFNKGTAGVQFSYSGTLSSYKDSIGINFNDTLDGFLFVNDAVLEYPRRQLNIKKINAEVYFTEEEFNVQCLQAQLNGNEIELNGQMSGIRRLLTDETDKMKGSFELFSPSFDISKVLLGKQTAVNAVKPKKTSSLSLVSSVIKRITTDITFDVNIHAAALHFRNLTAQNIAGKMRLSSSGLSLNNFQMSSCKGNILISARLNTQGATDQLEAEASVTDVDVTHFFRSADNFSQDAITHENLSGLLSANVHFRAALDNRYNPLTDSIHAKIFFSLKDGELIDYGPVAKIDNFIFKKRDMKNIRFAEIKDTFVLAGRELSIMKMEVASSVMRLFLKGKYTFNGPTEIFVQVPLSNLRKPDADEAVNNLGLEEKPGASIFLKVHGTAGNLKVSLAPSARKEMKDDSQEQAPRPRKSQAQE